MLVLQNAICVLDRGASCIYNEQPAFVHQNQNYRPPDDVALLSSDQRLLVR